MALDEDLEVMHGARFPAYPRSQDYTGHYVTSGEVVVRVDTYPFEGIRISRAGTVGEVTLVGFEDVGFLQWRL